MKKDPTGYITFVFGIQMIMSWFSMSGIFTGDSYLYYGLFCLACFPVYMQAGKDYMKLGDVMNSTLYYIFGTLFAGTMGLCYIAQFFDGIYHWGLEYNFIGAMTLVGGIYLIPIVFMSVYLPWTEFATWLCVTVMMLVMGLSGFVGEALGYIFL